MEALELKIFYYLTVKAIFIWACCVKRIQFWMLHRVVTCYNCANANVKRRWRFYMRNDPYTCPKVVHVTFTLCDERYKNAMVKESEIFVCMYMYEFMAEL